MRQMKRKLDELEQKANAVNGEKQRLVLFHEEGSLTYGCAGHSYVEDELDALRERYDLLIIRIVESHDWLGENEEL